MPLQILRKDHPNRCRLRYSEKIANWDWRAFPPADDKDCKIPGLKVGQDHVTNLVSSAVGHLQSCPNGVKKCQ